MIQMKSGVYGGKHKLIRPEDGPFSLSPAEEARLVNRKVAVYVGGTEPVSDPGEDGAPIGFDEMPPAPPEQPDLPDGVTGIPEYNVDMKATELREIGAMCGLTFKVGMTKAEMVAALDKHIEENTVEDEGIPTEEDAPTFDAAEAVQ